MTLGWVTSSAGIFHSHNDPVTILFGYDVCLCLFGCLGFLSELAFGILLVLAYFSAAIWCEMYYPDQ